ncbi:MAG: hypothetical protein OEL50_04370 [Rhodospirillaceae bacterium]|nr:hypothetical protein [Rhodospirillaceae bacterium]
MPHRKPELERIIKELENFVQTTCEYDPAHPKEQKDFVGERCNDAILMLRDANEKLKAQDTKK